MEFTKVELKLIEAYSVLVMAGKKTIEEVPEKLREATEIRIAEKTIEKLG